MQTITRLVRQANNRERISVYLDGEFAFGLHEVAAVQLRIGQQLSQDDVTALRYEDDITRAVEKTVQLLSYRPRSKAEITAKLEQKEYLPSVIEAAIEKVERMGYLDDRDFARFWIDNRNQHKPRGERALRYELRNKGVEDRIIDELLDELVDEASAAYEAAQKRLRRLRGKTMREFKDTLGAFLQRRGFSYDAIRQALDKHIAELAEADPTYFDDEAEWF